MRFLMLNWRDPVNPASGGAERVSLAYLSALKDRGHEVFWFSNQFEGCKFKDMVRGIEIVRGGGRGTSVLRARRWYGDQRRFDLVIDQHHGIPWYAPWWSGTNCVAYIHEVLGPIWRAFYSWPLSSLGRWQERWTHWLYRNIPFWTPSDSTKRLLHSHGVREVTVFPNGTDATPLEQLDSKQLTVPVQLIAVARLAPNKRVEHAIQALALLLRGGIQARLTVIGSGESESLLRAAADEAGIAGNVTFTGQLAEKDKDQCLRSAHFLVHTSIREGWGLNVIEANALGTPAIVYPVGGLVDSTVNGETGVITDQESPQSVADSVAALLQNPDTYARLRLNAWERSKAFQWKHVLPKACEWLEMQATMSRK